jgi:hypothetical protein
MLGGVALLALKFHWSRESILNLPLSELEYYLEILTKAPEE